MSNKYDAIIIGAGSAGLGMMGVAKELGWKFLMVEKNRDHVGGDCLNFGCVPSKALIYIAKQFYAANKATAFGLRADGKADIKKVLDYVHQKQEIIRALESADYLEAQGVELLIGEASFVSNHSIEVNKVTYTADKFFICTGSRPRWINFPGIEQVESYTNETLFYKMEKLPDRLLVVGGGPIGCEMAQAFSRLGSQVTIINRSPRLLSKEREEISEILENRFQKEQITMHNNCSLVSFPDRHTAEFKVRSNGEVKAVNFDAVLLSIGRILNHDSLNVPSAGIAITENGKILLNEYFQTTNKDIFVLGDAAGTYQFSHGAEKMVKLVKHNLQHSFSKRKHKAQDISWVTFTDPEIAKFGWTEEQLKDANIKYWRQDQSFHKDDRAITADYMYGQLTLFTSLEKNKLKRKIYGGTMIAPNAGDLVQELHLECEAEVKLEAFLKKVYTYPSAGRINQQTIMGIVNYDG